MQTDKTILLNKQERVFRIAGDLSRYGLTLKMISMDSGIHYDSIRNYAAGKTEMPLSAFNALIGVLPDELLSLLLPEAKAIVSLPEGIDHDEIEDMCADYMATKAKAHHKDSPAGREISDCEREALNVAYLPLQGKVA